MVAQHVHHAYGRQCYRVQVGPLGHAGSDEQAAVRSAGDRQLLLRRVFVVDQVLGRRDEVVEYVLLVGEHAGPVPFLAVFAATSKVHHGIDSALFHQQHAQRREAGRQADVESAVAVQVSRIVAVELHILAVYQKHRDGRAVLAVEKDLFGCEPVRIELQIGSFEHARLARSDVVPQLLAREVVLRYGALGLVEVEREQRSAGHRRPFEQQLRLGQQLAQDRFGSVEVRLHQPVARSALVRVEDGAAVARVNQSIIVSEAGEQYLEFGRALRQVGPQHLVAARALGRENEQMPVVLADFGAHVSQRVGAVLVDQAVGALLGPELVEKDFLEAVLRDERLGLLRLVVAAVIEAVPGPDGARELDPADHVGQQFARGHVHHADLDPVRTGRGGRIGAILAVLRERYVAQRDRTVVRQLVRVEEYLGRTVEAFLAVEHALVLQPVVLEKEKVVAVLARHAVFRIVPELGQPVADLVAERDLRQVVLRDFVFGRHPGGRLGRVVVLQPAVRIGHFRSEVVVDRAVHAGDGIRQCRDFHFRFTVRAQNACRDQQCGGKQSMFHGSIDFTCFHSAASSSVPSSHDVGKISRGKLRNRPGFPLRVRRRRFPCCEVREPG